MSTEPEILFERKGGVELITLNRPEALNALSLNMIRLLDSKLDEAGQDKSVSAVIIKGAGDKAFCAGGDVKAVYFDGLANRDGQGGSLTSDFFREEYILNRRIFKFPKPYIALLDGITMGGGKGISAHGSHRIVTEKTMFAMPETGIGFFPDVGGGHFLPRCPGETGLYLAMTGSRVGPSDVLYIGYGTHYIASDHLDHMIEDLAGAKWDRGDALAVANSVIANYTKEPPDEPSLEEFRLEIDRHFAFDSVEDILVSLHDGESDWAEATFQTLMRMSPTSLKVTLEQLRRGLTMDFDDVMTMEFRLSQRFMAGHDFYEGIRAQLVDKDRNPKWSPATIEGVTAQAIGAYFEPLGRQDLGF